MLRAGGAAETVLRLPLVQGVLVVVGIDGAVISLRIGVGVGLETAGTLRDRIRKQEEALQPGRDVGCRRLICGVLLRAPEQESRDSRKGKAREEMLRFHRHLSRSAPGMPTKTG